MSPACTQHSKARSRNESRSGSVNRPYDTSSPAAPRPANDTVRNSECPWSRQAVRSSAAGPGSPAATAGSAAQYASVRAVGEPSSPPGSGSARPSEAATSPSTVIKWPMTPATVVSRRAAPRPSNHRRLTGARHSA
ncbi:hypothetical protein ADK38_29780, partial [Streptomyces varsoviensis]